jgi:NADPH-dependent 2,4-dienoyl-CoA reductase/sulfur reductase-like enzyme
VRASSSCEEDNRLGGRLLSDGGEIDGMPAAEWVRDDLAELASLPDVRIMPRTHVFGVYDGGIYGALERVNDHLPVPAPHQPRQRVWRIVAKRSVSRPARSSGRSSLPATTARA